MKLIVCPLADVPDLCRRDRPSELLTLLSPGSPEPELGDEHAPDRRLRLTAHDIDGPREGLVAPDAALVARLLAFSAEWSRTRPFLIHCWAGISRSTAAAFVIACQHRPDLAEGVIATALRRASAIATPNPLIVAHADRLLGRDGRMMAAVRRIGRGQEAAHGKAFELPLAALGGAYRNHCAADGLSGS